MLFTMETVTIIVGLLLLAGWLFLSYLPHQAQIEASKKPPRTVVVQPVRRDVRRSVREQAQRLKDKAQLQLAQMQYAPEKTRGRHRIETPGGVRASELIGGRA